MEPLYLLSTSLAVAVVAYVYSQVLTDSGMLLNRVYNWSERTLPGWLFKPVIGCYHCVSGQMAFWYYLIIAIALNRFQYDPFQHILFICLTIFLISFIHKAYAWSKQL